MAILDFRRERTSDAASGSEPRSASVREATPAQAPRVRYVVTAAERAECTCPEFCERDHANE
jgi:hypothetical protein